MEQEIDFLIQLTEHIVQYYVNNQLTVMNIVVLEKLYNI